MDVKLPKLEIHPFDGNVTKWTTFWDSFESAIDSSSRLSDIDKFNYLRSLLEKTAADAISRLTLTAANYKEAVSILKKRFGNKQRIIDKHLETLLHLDAVTSQNNVRGLRKLYDLVETQVRGLKSLGTKSDTFGSLLSPVLIRKVPLELQLILSREIGDGSWKFDDLLQRLHDEIAARERLSTVAAHNDPRPSKSLSTGATLLTSSHETTCCYCQRSHPSHMCKSVSSVEDRRSVLRDSGRCFICLKKGHISRRWIIHGGLTY